jgi:hypothetical protein
VVDIPSWRNFGDCETKSSTSLPANASTRIDYFGFAEELGRQQKKILLRGNLCAQAKLFLDSTETID